MTQLVAIINITPDSFSDGGAGDYTARIAQAIADGASVLDLGAESTRPGATLITPEEEWQRLQPVLAAHTTSHWPLATTLSIDTRHPETFRKALGLGAKWFNDVSGFQNPESVKLAAECGCDIVLMHSLSVPADPKHTLPEGCDVISEILKWGERRIGELTSAGIAREKIIFDPGLGFGKTAAQSWQIVEQVEKLKDLGLRLLIGHSRKSFLGGPMEERDAKTAELTRHFARQGIDYLRVHNVKINKEALC